MKSNAEKDLKDLYGTTPAMRARARRPLPNGLPTEFRAANWK